MAFFFCLSCFFDGYVVIRPVGPRPASKGRGQTRTPSLSPGWQTGSCNYHVMNTNRSNEPWLDFSFTCWPLAAHHHAEVFAVWGPMETDDTPLWSGLLSPTAVLPRSEKTGPPPKLP